MTEETKKDEKKEVKAEVKEAEKKEEKKEVKAEVKEAEKKDEKKEVKAEVKEAEKKEEKKEVKAEVKKILTKIEALNSEDKKALGLEIVKSLTVLELSEWVKSMEEEFGVTAAAPVAAFGAIPGGGVPAEQEEKQTSFSVVLSSFGEKKIQVIKEVRAITSLGLKEAKELVESAPTVIKEDISKEEAEEIKKKVEAAGATVEVK